MLGARAADSNLGILQPRNFDMGEEELTANGRIVMTGAAGAVANMVLPHLRDQFDDLVLTDRHEVENGIRCELTDRTRLRTVLEGAQGVIHLGGQPVEADWRTIRECNFEGTHALFECARLEGVERIVFASSNHAAGYFPSERPFGNADVFRPDSLYGVSKVFGESLCMLYADKYGMRTFAIRIGTALPAPNGRRTLSTWVHPEDLAQLMLIGLTDDRVHAEIVYGVSDALYPYFDNSRARRLGYVPRHRAADFLEKYGGGEAPFDFIGGSFASLADSADKGRTLSAVSAAANRSADGSPG